jgi:hypothetical protein
MANDQLHHKRATSLEKLRRRQGKREPQKTYLIVCEGTTEESYFKALCGSRSNVTVTKSGGSCPMGIVKYAQEEMKYYHAIICVFDKEFDKGREKKFKQANQNLERLAKQYTKQKIIGAWSVPCFEVWFLLHFDCSSSPFSCCDEVEKALKKKNGFEEYNKSDKGHYQLLRDRTKTAITNAAALYEESQHNQSDNPSTTVHCAVEFLLKEFSPQ